MERSILRYLEPTESVEVGKLLEEIRQAIRNLNDQLLGDSKYGISAHVNNVRALSSGLNREKGSAPPSDPRAVIKFEWKHIVDTSTVMINSLAELKIEVMRLSENLSDCVRQAKRCELDNQHGNTPTDCGADRPGHQITGIQRKWTLQ